MLCYYNYPSYSYIHLWICNLLDLLYMLIIYFNCIYNFMYWDWDFLQGVFRLLICVGVLICVGRRRRLKNPSCLSIGTELRSVEKTRILITSLMNWDPFMLLLLRGMSISCQSRLLLFSIFVWLVSCKFNDYEIVCAALRMLKRYQLRRVNILEVWFIMFFMYRVD